jgi:GT2 family glycosyltransferase
MTKAYSIGSVTVATNAARILPRQLESLNGQTRKLDEIIVVDNGSVDGTRELLATQYPEVTVLSLPENRGVGGALSEGLSYTTRVRKHDWTWLLDDDSVPSPDGLQRLLAGLQQLGEANSDIAILAPVAVHQGTQLSTPGYLWRNGLRRPGVEATHQDVFFADIVISSGTLIRKEAVETVGLPRADFFMDFVDHELCLRLRRHGYRIAVVTGCQLDHAIGDPRRISLFGFHRAWSDHAPWREYYMTRNEIFTIWSFYPDWKTKSSVMRRLFRHAVGVLLFGEQKASCLKMMCQGFLDGCAGRLGIRFLPDQPNPRSAVSQALESGAFTGRIS